MTGFRSRSRRATLIYVLLATLPAAALVTVDRAWAVFALVPAIFGIGGIIVSAALMRLAYIGTGFSDPLLVTEAARDRVLDGLSPYGVGYAEATITGASFPYGPVMLINTIPLEIAASIGILILLRNRPLTLSAYAGAPFAISLASSGNNDHLPAFLLAAGLLTLPRWWGGLLIGISVAVKPYTAVFIPALLAGGSIGPFLVATVAAIAAWLPAFWWGGVGESFAILNAQQQSSMLRYLALPFALGAVRFGVVAACIAYGFLTLTSEWWSLGYLIPVGVAAGIAIEGPSDASRPVQQLRAA